MNGWTWQAWVGLIGGFFIFFSTLVPVLLFQVRRYGQMSLLRVLGAAGVSVYAVALLAYTFLPLPADRANCGLDSGGLEVVPGHSIFDIARETAGLSFVGTLISPSLLQVVMNVVLFIPFGIIVRRFWGRSFLNTIVLGAAVSFLIEATQFTATWGLYACSYRVADVDDLITNTLGAAIGALLAPVVLSWMPSTRVLGATRNEPRPVSVWRRWLGMVIDAFVIQVSFTMLTVPFSIWTNLDSPGAFPPAPPVPAQALLVYGVTLLAVIAVPAGVGTGASLGQRLVFLTPVTDERRVPRARLFLRAAVIAMPYATAAMLSQFAGLAAGFPSLITSAIALVSFTVVACAVMSVIPTRNHRGLSYVLAGLDIRDSRSATPSPVVRA